MSPCHSNSSVANKIGLFLKRYRKSNGISLNILAEKAGLTPSFVFRLEKSEYDDVKIGVVIKLAKALNMSLEDFLKRTQLIDNTQDLPEFEHYLKQKFDLPQDSIDQLTKMLEFIQFEK